MAKNRLAKLLLEEHSVQTQNGAVTSFGLDQIINVRGELNKRLFNFDESMGDYDPLFEIAKLGRMTDDEDLAFKCHSKLADYMYPQVKSLEIQAKEDREVTVTVQIAGYAQQKPVEVEAEEIETEGDLDDEKPDYVQYVLEQAIKEKKQL